MDAIHPCPPASEWAWVFELRGTSSYLTQMGWDQGGQAGLGVDAETSPASPAHHASVGLRLRTAKTACAATGMSTTNRSHPL